MLFDRNLIEENEFIEALLVTAGLDGYSYEFHDKPYYRELIFYRGYHKFDGENTINMSVSKRTGKFLAGIQKSITQKNGIKTRQTTHSIDTYGCTNMQALESVVKWF